MAQIEIAGKYPGMGAMLENPPRVSVLMPAFNAAETLADAAASVVAQSAADWELIIVDDASADGTRAVAEALTRSDPRIRLISLERNGGAAAARNMALGAARGRYIAFLDSDDLWLPHKLARQIAFMEQTGTALCYSGFWRMRAGEPDTARRLVRVPDRIDRAGLLRGNVIGCLTAIYDRDRLGDCPMPDLRLRQDYALWLDILSRTPHAHGLDAPLAVHRQRSGSLSANKWQAIRATWFMYTGHLRLPAHRAAWYLGQHLVKRLARG